MGYRCAWRSSVAVVLLALDLVRSGMNITARCRKSVLSALFAFVGERAVVAGVCVGVRMDWNQELVSFEW